MTGTDVTVDYGQATTMEVTVEADGVVPTGTVTLKVGDVQLGTGNDWSTARRPRPSTGTGSDPGSTR